MGMADAQVKSFTHESEPGHCLFTSPSCIVLKLNILFRDACRNSIPATLLLSQLYSSPWDRLFSSFLFSFLLSGDSLLQGNYQAGDLARESACLASTGT